MANNKIKESTQQHLDIDDITEDLVLLRSGNAAMILSTTAVNFDILSEAEQDATIYAYGALLNSLSFPVQILIRSKKADISSYFSHLSEALESQPNPDLKMQIKKYMDFIQATVQQRTVLDKRFYLVISFSPIELGLKVFKKSKGGKVQSKNQLLSDAKISLAPKRDHLIKQTSRLGLITKQLATREIIELFYDIYNPAPTGTTKVVIDSASYSTPVVEPALEVPVPAPAPSVATPAPQSLGQQQPQPPTPQPVASTPASTQQEALKNLQDAAAKASRYLSGGKQVNTLAVQNQTQTEK